MPSFLSPLSLHCWPLPDMTAKNRLIIDAQFQPNSPSSDLIASWCKPPSLKHSSDRCCAVFCWLLSFLVAFSFCLCSSLLFVLVLVFLWSIKKSHQGSFRLFDVSEEREQKDSNKDTHTQNKNENKRAENWKIPRRSQTIRSRIYSPHCSWVHFPLHRNSVKWKNNTSGTTVIFHHMTWNEQQPLHGHKDAGRTVTIPLPPQLRSWHRSSDSTWSSPAIRSPTWHCSSFSSPPWVHPPQCSALQKANGAEPCLRQSFMFLFSADNMHKHERFIDGLGHKPPDDEIIEICIGRTSDKTKKGRRQTRDERISGQFLLDIDQLRPGRWLIPWSVCPVIFYSAQCSRALINACTTCPSSLTKKMKNEKPAECWKRICQERTQTLELESFYTVSMSWLESLYQTKRAVFLCSPFAFLLSCVTSRNTKRTWEQTKQQQRQT